MEQDSNNKMEEREIKSLLSNIKFIKKDGNQLYLKIGVQEFTVSLPGTPSEFYFIEIVNHQPGYDWLNRVNEFIFEKAPKNLKILIDHIEEKYSSEKERKRKILELFDEPEIKIDMFDINEQKYRRSIESQLNSLKSILNLNIDSQKTPILFSGQTPGLLILDEFFKLRKKYSKDDKMVLTLVNDNIYHWNLKMRGFTNKILVDSLSSLNAKYGYNYIEFEIHFHDKLYPCYPPFLKAVRPRLEDDLIYRISNMKMIQFEFWSPCRGIEFVIGKLWKALETSGIIDFDSEMNDLTKYPLSAYHSLESILIKLSSLCDIKDNYTSLDTEEYCKVINISKKDLQSAQTKKKSSIWKMGTGYGTDGSSNWDVSEYIKIQEEKDRQIRSVLNIIIENIQNYGSEELPTVYKIIKSSYIVSFIKTYIAGTNILDIEKHIEMYKLLFTLMQILTTEDSIYLFDDNRGEKSLYQLLEILYNEAKELIKMTGHEGSNDADLEIPNIICTVFEMMMPLMNNYIEVKKKVNDDEAKKWEEKICDAKNNANPLHVNYQNVMSKLKFDTIKFGGKFKFIRDSSFNKATVRRLQKEYISLMKDLPIYYESSIFVRINEEDNRCLKVLITGPKDTPYDSGIFIFDVFVGNDYPKNSPKMLFLNTGNKRFNPNLYNCGKVCLSLLGTWSGHGGEKWNPNTSTLQQLFISVQSQILIEEPFYNEPGYETTYNSVDGKLKSNKYNNNIKLYTLTHAMCDLLNDPTMYPEFTDVIKGHFALKKDYIKSLCDKWSGEAFDNIVEETKNCCNTIKQLLDKLES